MSTQRVLLVEPYFGGSHRAWASGYADHSAHDVILVTHEARFWKWRMQGSHLTLAGEARKALRDTGPPDVVLASSMLDLAAFLGAARDVVGNAAVALYMHENQLTYPRVEGEALDLAYPMKQWVGMAVADRIYFNSAFHREAWFEALPPLLKHFPDYTHNRLIPQVVAKTEVLPVGVDLRRLDGDRLEPSVPPLVLWNHRWEHDKNPAEFFAALDVLAGEGLDFRVALAGESFRNVPEEFDAARLRLGERVVHFGYADQEGYVDLVRQADVVVSTARHEFFGVAVVEAIYAGAFPVLPNRLSYPELIDRAHHDDCLYDDFDGLCARLRRALTDPSSAHALAADLRPAMARFDWKTQGPEYDEALSALAAG